MQLIDRLKRLEQLKLLADERRMKILRLLMASPASLTQLAGRLAQSPAWVRHHVQKLASAGLIELVEVKVTRGVTEKFYRARSAGFLIQQMLLPDSDHPILVLSGSHDLALELLAENVHPHLDVLSMPIGSLDGLAVLRQGLSHISGVHLFDASGEYNTPYIRYFFPDRRMQVLTLAYREQGLMVAPGNPKGIRSLADLGREDVTFVNRNRGSGTRLWLDDQLKRLGIDAGQIRGYQREVFTHTEAAKAVLRGEAHTGLGLRAAACRQGLDFVALFQERYDLVVPDEQIVEIGFAPLFNQLQSRKFRQEAKALGGYDMSHTGERQLYNSIQIQKEK